MDRRTLLQLGGASALSSVSWRLWATPAPSQAAQPRFLLIFLRGAYDALSAVVPYAEPFYYEARPRIAIGRSAGGPDEGLRLDGRWSLHPALADSLMPRYRAGELAFVPFSGTGFVSRSHFQAQDWMELGLAPDRQPAGGNGFLARLLERLGADDGRHAAVSFTSRLPLALRGSRHAVNASVQIKQGEPASPDYESLLKALYEGHAAADLVQGGLGLRREISRELADEMRNASRDALPARGFALEAARVARLMLENPQYSVGFIDVGGWDTHAGQGAELGVLSNRLHALGEGLEALATGLKPAWRQTVVVVMSEFGRTFRENGSQGTDHGHGSALWVLGGGVRGAALRGEQGRLGPQDLHEGRDLPVLNEYRNTLAGLLRRMYGLKTADLMHVFPQSAPADLGLI